MLVKGEVYEKLVLHARVAWNGLLFALKREDGPGKLSLADPLHAPLHQFPHLYFPGNLDLHVCQIIFSLMQIFGIHIKVSGSKNNNLENV